MEALRRCGQLSVAGVLGIALYGAPALALDKIYSPNVEYREMSVEYNASRSFDHDRSKDNVQSHELSFEAGITPRIQLEVGAGFAKASGDSLQLEDVELEGRFQFFEQGENWMDSGLLLAYGFGTQSHAADAVEAKLLLQKDIGMTTTMVNVGLEQAVGAHAGSGGPEYALLWNTRYRYSKYFQPGIELQSEFGQNPRFNQLDEQEHYIGPAAYGKIYGPLKYQAAYLFGVSDAASQGAGRLTIEYEMHF